MFLWHWDPRGLLVGLWYALPYVAAVLALLLCVGYLLARPWRSRRPPFREAPMLFQVGRPGSGKTLRAVKMAIERMREGVPVYANLPIIDPVSGRRAGVVRGWGDCFYLTDELGLRNFAVLIDEGNVWACSRRSKDAPTRLLSWWAQRRHYGVEIWLTAQHENRVDVVLRETVDKIEVCERFRFLPKWLPVFKVTACFPEELEALRAGRMPGQGPPWERMPWWVFEGYGTAYIVTHVEYDRNDLPEAAGVKVSHPNYLPGVRWDGRKLDRRLRRSYPRWEAWMAYLASDAGLEVSPAGLSTSEVSAWLASEEGWCSVVALGA